MYREKDMNVLAGEVLSKVNRQAICKLEEGAEMPFEVKVELVTEDRFITMRWTVFKGEDGQRYDFKYLGADL